MVLSDRDILRRVRTQSSSGELVIEPFEKDNVEPASVDLRLGEDFKRPRRVLNKKLHEPITLDADEKQLQMEEMSGSVELKREDFILATTKERVEIPDDMVAHVLGRSSLGRLGISVHQTAGYIDPGFTGQITLELSNHGPAPITFKEDQRICQIVFEELSSPALHPYGHEGSQYQEQSGATRSGMDFD